MTWLLVNYYARINFKIKIYKIVKDILLQSSVSTPDGMENITFLKHFSHIVMLSLLIFTTKYVPILKISYKEAFVS